MSKKQEMYRKNLLAKIHIHKRYKEIKEVGFWEDWLEVRYGVTSSKTLSINELKEVLELLNNKVADRDYIISDNVGRAMLLPLAKRHQTQSITKQQALHIEHLLNILRYNDKQKKAFFTKQINKESDSIAALSKEEATKIIIGLQKIRQWDYKRLRYANNRDFKK